MDAILHPDAFRQGYQAALTSLEIAADTAWMRSGAEG
jgi:hypothetical protein